MKFLESLRLIKLVGSFGEPRLPYQTIVWVAVKPLLLWLALPFGIVHLKLDLVVLQFSGS